MELSELGIVGCGGAGFPTHVKLSAKNIDSLIVNGAECEPLLHKDKEILFHFTNQILSGIKFTLEMTGAKKAYLAVKKKYSSLLSHLEASCNVPWIQVLPLGDFYPSGDEYELVYEATGKLIPFGGIPLDIGCVVSNVETLLNISRQKPFITKFLTINGAVPNPITIEVPIGAKIGEILSLTGTTDWNGMTIIDGGPMMGRIIESPDEVVTKTCGGLLVIPSEHPFIKKITRTSENNRFIARSSCDQCTDCSELCPRHLLGYPINPHKAMRTAQMSQFESSNYSLDSIFCCECGLCSLFACPEDLPPREIAKMAKSHHLASGAKLKDWPGNPMIHPMRSFRRVSISQLVKRIGLTEFDHPAPYSNRIPLVSKVRLPLKMHIGAPSVPIVKVGEKVIAGQIIGKIPNGKLGATLHSSIAGKVELIDSNSITISG
ncbi:MAG: 4Fe-4S dicluster domain-containing protein [Candidatus Riflebacteria bacterium]|nr:4Fe-4S dicluster domain-containing protein [Candidatus Riflebacteria bacterium]